MTTKPKVPTGWELINWAVIITSNYLVYTICGGWGLAYLLLSTFFSMGMHPAGAHTIAEHCKKKKINFYYYYHINNYFKF